MPMRVKIFHFVVTTLVLFCAESLNAAWKVVQKDALLGDIAIETNAMLRNKMLVVKVSLEPKYKDSFLLESFEAQMPEHRHGMIVKPQIVLKPDSFEVRGVKFHMAGAWVIHMIFSEKISGKKINVSVPLQLN